MKQAIIYSIDIPSLGHLVMQAFQGDISIKDNITSDEDNITFSWIYIKSLPFY